mmetsp:Transcript_39785/g.49175  ORF Transcript_39785/g.49175 Transcript_39785/m.49175 type:complete len:300 (+) Transcript_39785:189-1088(+)
MFEMVTFSWEVILIYALSGIMVLITLIYILIKGKINWDVILPKNDYDIYTKSHCMSTLYITIYRSIITFFFLAVTMYVIMEYGIFLFSTYTFWNFVICVFYFACVSLFGWFEIITKNAYTSSPKMNKFRQFIWILFQIESGNVFLICIVVWTVLYIPATDEIKEQLVNFANIVMHVINVIALLIDLIISHIPIDPYSFIFCIVLSLIYGYFAWIIFAIYEWTPYPFLYPDEPINALVILFVFLFHILCWLFVFFIAKFRDKKCKLFSKMDSEEKTKILDDPKLPTLEIDGTMTDTNDII